MSAKKSEPSAKNTVLTKYMSTKKVFESEDLVRHIYSFGSDDHRVKMKKIGKELKKGFSKVLSQYKPGPGDHLKLQGLTMLETLESFFLYKRCYCCSAHSYKDDIHIEEGKLVFTQVKFIDNRVCRCMCRHNSRIMFGLIAYRY